MLRKLRLSRVQYNTKKAANMKSSSAKLTRAVVLLSDILALLRHCHLLIPSNRQGYPEASTQPGLGRMYCGKLLKYNGLYDFS